MRKARGQSGSPAQFLCISTVHKGKAGGQVRLDKQTARGGISLGCFRLLTAVAASVLFLVIVELILMLAGFGYPTTFFIPGKDPATVNTNDWFTWFYHRTPLGSPQPCIVSVEKPVDTVRVFVLGEAAAMGTPNPAFGVSRILETMLQTQYPGKTVEVINAAVRGIHSFMIVDIARECAVLSPDAFVVYMGNNEICGLYGSESFLSRHPGWIEPLHQIRCMRVSQLFTLVLQGHPSRQTPSDKTQTDEYFLQHRVAFDDPRRMAVWDNFERNLRTICGIGRQAGATVLVSTVASNLEDCPPLGSLHRPDLTAQQTALWERLVRQGGECEASKDYPAAIESFQTAMAIDDHYAELHYRLARCLKAVGKLDDARQRFELARDWDAVQFRADSRINAICRKVVAEAADPGVSLADAEKLLAEDPRCDDGILGAEIFGDPIHFNFDGDYALAKILTPAMVTAMNTQRDMQADASATIPTRAECAKRLAFTAWDELNTAAGLAKSTAVPPFTMQMDHDQRQSRIDKAIAEREAQVDAAFINRIVTEYREAITANPRDCMLRYNLATLLYQLQRFPEAADLMMPIAEAFPHTSQFRVCLGYALGQSGRKDLAAAQFRLALKEDSRFKPAKDALRWALNGTTTVTQSD